MPGVVYKIALVSFFAAEQLKRYNKNLNANRREKTMKTLRTPDERFDNLPGYSFDPHYLEVDDTEGG